MYKRFRQSLKTGQINFAWLVIALLLVWLSASAIAYAGEPGYTVKTVSKDWVDTERDGRLVPIKAYLPEDSGGVGGAGRHPVIIFSHGLGGSRDGYSYLGEHWASNGYVSVHLQHLGSDNAVWQDEPRRKRMRAMKNAIKDIDNSLNRAADVSFVIDQLETHNDDPTSPLHNRLDLTRIGMAGHSYGAFTSMAIAGQNFITRNGRVVNLHDDRVTAAVVMSAQAPSDPEDYARGYEDIGIPIFHMTGTKDTSMVNPSSPVEHRRVAYDHTPGPADGGPDAYLVTFTDGDHMVFSGRPRRFFNRTAEKDEVFQAHIKTASTAFWDAYLKDDIDSLDWLRNDGFRDELGDTGTYEVKP